MQMATVAKKFTSYLLHHKLVEFYILRHDKGNMGNPKELTWDVIACAMKVTY